MKPEERIHQYLEFLYGEETAQDVHKKIIRIIEEYSQKINAQKSIKGRQLSERDAILITYGDQLYEEDQFPLQSLSRFLGSYLQNIISGVHILPFYPYSSDDGFSVIDYCKVDPSLGNWEDIEIIGKSFRLMVDAVINHISKHSEWFNGFLQGEKEYKDYFICVDPEIDLSQVVRPRALPLLTPFKTVMGKRYVWTTFSEDQIDLNFENPQVLLEIIELLLFYVSKGAEIIRLDAIAYLWKEIGTPSIHLPQTHAVVKIWRAVLDKVAPKVILITETNVPHEDNISYFGNFLPEAGQTDEAQLVYQFPLAPLVLHTLRTGNSLALSKWADGLDSPGMFFNFIASHDGIGVMPAKGLLEDNEIESLVERTLSHGGQVSYKFNPDGSRSVYELNITLYDWLNNPKKPEQRIDVRRFLASQAIMLSLAGVPGIYFHSLFGSRNCYSCVEETGRARSINREKLELNHFLSEVNFSETHTNEVFVGYKKLLSQRRNCPAFRPQGKQKVLFLNNNVFGLIRISPEHDKHVICLINITDAVQTVQLDQETINLYVKTIWNDILADEASKDVSINEQIQLEPYQIMWLIHN
jgi:sucrose phosphorylase